MSMPSVLRQATRGMAWQSSQGKRQSLALFACFERGQVLSPKVASLVKEHSPLAISIKYVLIKNSLCWKDAQRHKH